jgi:hypothetical protein
VHGQPGNFFSREDFFIFTTQPISLPFHARGSSLRSELLGFQADRGRHGKQERQTALSFMGLVVVSAALMVDDT